MEEWREELSHSLWWHYWQRNKCSMRACVCVCVQVCVLVLWQKRGRDRETESTGRCLHSLCGRLKAICRGQRDKRGKRVKERKRERDREGRIKWNLFPFDSSLICSKMKSTENKPPTQQPATPNHTHTHHLLRSQWSLLGHTQTHTDLSVVHCLAPFSPMTLTFLCTDCVTPAWLQLSSIFNFLLIIRLSTVFSTVVLSIFLKWKPLYHQYSRIPADCVAQIHTD